MTDADLIRSYADAMSGAIWFGTLLAADRGFRDKHRIGVDHPLHERLKEIFALHQRRIDGKSSPRECDEAVGELLG